MKSKLEKKAHAQMYQEIKDKVVNDIMVADEAEGKLRAKYQAELDKKLAQEKRKMKLIIEETKNEMEEQMKKNFDHEVRKQVIEQQAKRDKSIDRRYRLQY